MTNRPLLGKQAPAAVQQAGVQQATAHVGEAQQVKDEIALLHPLQEAFVEHGATQCGFCTPGFIMQAKTLLDANHNPTDEEIKHCLKDTYCRCTGYASILTAVKAAAEQMRTGHLPLPHCPKRSQHWRPSATAAPARCDRQGHRPGALHRRLSL